MMNKADKAGGCYGENHSFKAHSPVTSIGSQGQIGGKAPKLHHDKPLNVRPGGQIKSGGSAGGFKG
jgi:hypothetical protein